MAFGGSRSSCVRPDVHYALRQDSRNGLTPCRMALHFVSAGAHAPHSDEPPGPTATRGSSHSARRLRSLAFLCSSMDDATNEHYLMRLVAEEGTASSFMGVRDVIRQRGLFASLYTDRGSHYWYTPEAGGKVAKENPTPFGKAVARLGIEMIRPTLLRHEDTQSACSVPTRGVAGHRWHPRHDSG